MLFLRVITIISIFFTTQNIFSKNKVVYCNKSILISEHRVSSSQKRLLCSQIKRIQNYLLRNFKYHAKKAVKVHLFQNLNKYRSFLNIPYWIGGWYKNGHIYLQPIATLLKKRNLRKILFSEYFHFFLDEISGQQIPDFLNEYLSYYFYYHYQKKSISVPYYKNHKLSVFSYDEFLNPSRFIYRQEKMKQLFKLSLMFFSYCEKKYRKDFWQQFIIALAEDGYYEEIFYNLSGTNLEKAYKNFLLNQ